jgi:hypothetical protein
LPFQPFTNDLSIAAYISHCGETVSAVRKSQRGRHPEFVFDTDRKRFDDLVISFPASDEARWDCYLRLLRKAVFIHRWPDNNDLSGDWSTTDFSIGAFALMSGAEISAIRSFLNSIKRLRHRIFFLGQDHIFSRIEDRWISSDCKQYDRMLVELKDMAKEI